MWSLVSIGQQGSPDNRGFTNIQALIPIAVVIAILLVTLIVILLFPRLRSVKASKSIESEVHKIKALAEVLRFVTETIQSQIGIDAVKVTAQ